MLWDCIFRLLLAGVLGGVIGWDREYRAKEAGLRTHFLVALGSALIMIVSQYGFADVLAKPGYGLDPSRRLPVYGRLRVADWLAEEVCIGSEYSP